MIGAIGANVAGNLIAAPILNGGLAAGQSPVPVLTPEPVAYGYASSGAGGVLIGLNGKTTLVSGPKVQPARGESVPAEPNSLVYFSFAKGIGPLANAAAAEDPAAKDKLVKVEVKAKSDEKPDMNQSMLIGAVAGAVAAKLGGFHVLLGAGAGALVGHLYAGGAA
jgi:hypothetical protein